MRSRRFITAVIVAICLLAQAVLPVSATQDAEIIRQLLQYYAHHQEAARTDILRLLDQMRQQDPAQAEDWEAVMNLWSSLCLDCPVTPDVLPDGLPEDDSLCIAVMGFALNYNGSMRDELLGRMAVALASAEKYPNAFILCTGGGTAGGNYAVTEAGQMAAWLEEQGIAPERIIVENRSFSTELNARYSLEILRKDYPQVTSLALVSSDYHLRRCHWLFQSELIFTGRKETCRVVANSGYSAGYVGESGLWAEAESMGNLFSLRIRPGTPPALSSLEEIQVSGKTEYLYGELPELQVMASYDSGFSRDVTADAIVSGFDANLAGSQEITVSYTENGTTAASTLTVTIAEPPTEPSTEAPTTEPQETEPEPEESSEPTLEEVPEDETGSTPRWVIYVLIVLGCSLPLLILLLFRRKPRGKYQK